MTTPRHTLDRLELLDELADDAGHTLCLACLRHGRYQAGTLAAPPRDADDLTVAGGAAVQLLAQELLLSALLMRRDDLDRRETLLRVLVACRITAYLLPAASRDLDGRFSLTLPEDGSVPPAPADPGVVFAAYANRLHQHLDENDHTDWVDPNVIAGDVANIHDHVVHVLLWHELFGDYPIEPDHGCADTDDPGDSGGLTGPADLFGPEDPCDGGGR